MPTSLLLRNSRGLCAACAREQARLGASASAARRTIATAVTEPRWPPRSQRSQRPSEALALAPPAPRRLLSQTSRSTSPSASAAAAATAETHDKNPLPRQPTAPGPAAAKAEVLTQKPPSYYDLFPKTLPEGPPPRGPFAIDVRALRQEFLRLQAAAHPDFHHHAAGAADTTSASEEELASADGEGGGGRPRHSAARAQAEATSALINEAYKTLSSPLLRARYLLSQRHGVDLAGDEAGALGGGAGNADHADLLLTVLEAREEIEAAESEADLEGVRAANDERVRACEEALARAFAEDDIAAATREAVRLRYWVNIDETLRNWERGKGVPALEH